ncbi:MAG: hypothetical protein ACFFCS_10220 [Candidatus Hodarchaeota archaeon]
MGKKNKKPTKTKLKILLVGPRYTGKGQIGRAWGKTDADLPTLQPVILYDRIVKLGNKDVRVVAWVLSFDPEFKDLRHCFYKEPDGVIFTFDVSDDTGQSLKDMSQYRFELGGSLGCPQILAGVHLDEKKKEATKLRSEIDKRLEMWRKYTPKDFVQYFTLYYPDKTRFQDEVEKMFEALLKKIVE